MQDRPARQQENIEGPDLTAGALDVSLCALDIAAGSQAAAPCKAQGVLSISHAPLSNAQHKYGAWNLRDNEFNLQVPCAFLPIS